MGATSPRDFVFRAFALAAPVLKAHHGAGLCSGLFASGGYLGLAIRPVASAKRCRRAALPTRPKPAISIAHCAGSGTPGATAAEAGEQGLA